MTAKQKLHQSNLALWMARFNDQAASGLSVRVWCERNNLSYHAYNYWKHLAKESYVDAIMPDIVPISTPVISPQMPTISIPDTSSISPESSESPNPHHIVSIILDDIKIEIVSNASDEMIDQMSHQMSLFEMYDIFNEAEAASDESKEPDIKEEVLSDLFPCGYKELPPETYKRLSVIPQQFMVDEYHIHVYASKNNDGTIIKAERPADLFRNSLATPSIIGLTELFFSIFTTIFAT